MIHKELKIFVKNVSLEVFRLLIKLFLGFVVENGKTTFSFLFVVNSI